MPERPVVLPLLRDAHLLLYLRMWCVVSLFATPPPPPPGRCQCSTGWKGDLCDQREPLTHTASVQVYLVSSVVSVSLHQHCTLHLLSSITSSPPLSSLPPQPANCTTTVLAAPSTATVRGRSTPTAARKESASVTPAGRGSCAIPSVRRDTLDWAAKRG